MSNRLKATVTRDSDTLALLGKKQVLKRRFGFWSLFGFAVCELLSSVCSILESRDTDFLNVITWETVLALFSQGFENGGPAGLVYGFIIAWASTLSVYTVIVELASMAPIAGGQYYWVYMLAPPRWKVFSSYIIGWLTSLAWIATVATETIFAGTILQGLIVLSHPDYSPTQWQGTLLAWMVVLVCIFVNAVLPGLLPKFEIFIIFFHIAGFVAVLATLWSTASIGTADFVFTTAFNEGGWPTQGLSYCVGFLGNVATFVGADASVHLAEEVENAALNIPRAVIASMCLNGLVGFTMMLTLLFCLGDVESVLNTDKVFPFIQIFFNAVGSRAGATAMGAVVLVLTWSCAIGITTTASRMTWSFARDKGTPFSDFLGRVAPWNQVPINAIVVVCALAMALQCIYFGSSVAFNDVVSLTITGFYCSYLLPAGFLLWRRVRGDVAPYIKRSETEGLDGEMPFDAEEGMHGVQNGEGGSGGLDGNAEKQLPDDKLDDTLKPTPALTQSSPPPSHDTNSPTTTTTTTTPPRTLSIALPPLTWGPFSLPRSPPLGIINNAYACTYMLFVIFFSVWPPATPVDAESMNYSVVVTAGVVLGSVVWYWVRGRREYLGPRVDGEVEGRVFGAGRDGRRRVGSVSVSVDGMGEVD